MTCLRLTQCSNSEDIQNTFTIYILSHSLTICLDIIKLSHENELDINQHNNFQGHL